MASKSIAPQAVEFAKSQFENRLDVSYEKNNLQMLARYNRRVIEQCYERVYFSTKDAISL